MTAIELIESMMNDTASMTPKAMSELHSLVDSQTNALVNLRTELRLLQQAHRADTATLTAMCQLHPDSANIVVNLQNDTIAAFKDRAK